MINEMIEDYLAGKHTDNRYLQGKYGTSYTTFMKKVKASGDRRVRDKLRKKTLHRLSPEIVSRYKDGEAIWSIAKGLEVTQEHVRSVVFSNAIVEDRVKDMIRFSLKFILREIELGMTPDDAKRCWVQYYRGDLMTGMAIRFKYLSSEQVTELNNIMTTSSAAHY